MARTPVRHRRHPGCRQRRVDAGAGPGARSGRRPDHRRHRRSSSAATPGVRGPCSRRRSRRAWPAKGPTWSTSGVLPTPALAWLSEVRELPAAVISASHNPFADNGIKLFARRRPEAHRRHRGGRSRTSSTASSIPPAKGLRTLSGTRRRQPGQRARVGDAYVEPPELARARRAALTGLRLVVDCANGAASELAADRLRAARRRGDRHRLRARRDQHQRRLRVDLTATLAGVVVEHQADLGLALDGDADRLLAVDANGGLADGDELLALFAIDLAERGPLAGNTVVVTVMTNLGFRLAMEERGIRVVGDPGRRPLRAGRARRGRPHPRRRAVGPHRLPAAGHHRRRDADRAGPGRPGGAVRPAPGRAAATGWSPRCPRSWSTCPCPTPSCWPSAEAVWSAVAEEEARLGDARPGAAPAERDRAAGPGHGGGAATTGWPRRSPSG